MKKVVIILCFFLLLLIVSCDTVSKKDAFDAAKEFVYLSDYYDAPYAAVFCDYKDYRVKEMGNSAFKVSGYYSYGKYERSWTVYITYSNGGWKVGTFY